MWFGICQGLSQNLILYCVVNHYQVDSLSSLSDSPACQVLDATSLVM